tara:strand:- start:461 stop:913 length:453 start_codon:yes stop_codon:yes gene_type:complete
MKKSATFLLVQAIVSVVTSGTVLSDELDVRLGGCSVPITVGLTLVSRTPIETTFVSRSETPDVSIVTYRSHDEGDINGGEVRILSVFKRGPLSIYKLSIDSDSNVGGMNGTEYAYIHDEKYALAIVGPLAADYWGEALIRGLKCKGEDER